MAADAGVKHGGVTKWDVDDPGTFNTPSGQSQYKGMMANHSPGGTEPLVRLGDGPPKAVWHEPAVAPGAAAGGETRASSRPAGKEKAGPAGAGSGADPGVGARSGAASGAPAAAAAAPEPGPSFREQAGSGRPDVGDAFTAADERWAKAGGDGKPPSEQFDDAMRALEGAGMGAKGRAEVEGMLAPGQGQDALGSGRLSRATRKVDYLAQLVEADPDLLTPNGQRHRLASLEREATLVREAHGAGVTTEGRPIATPASPELRAVIDDMDAALAGHAPTPDDPVKGLMDLAELQERIARAGEVLRSYDRNFTSTLPELGDVEPSDILGGAHQRSISVGAEGRVAEPLARDLPGIGLERYQLSADGIRGLATEPPELAGQLADMVRGYQRSHLVGPGFGGELMEGMMLAPAAVNQHLQNEGVEAFVRNAAARGNEVHVRAHADGDRLVLPMRDGSPESIDILRRVTYDIEVNGKSFQVVIEIDAPPGGAARVVLNTIPDAAPGGAMLKGGPTPKGGKPGRR